MGAPGIKGGQLPLSNTATVAASLASIFTGALTEVRAMTKKILSKLQETIHELELEVVRAGVLVRLLADKARARHD